MIRYYLDTEFNSFGGVMLSLALVCEDDRVLYLIDPDCFGGWDGGCLIALDPWVEENVFPHLRSVPDHVKITLADPSEWGPYLSDFIYGRGDHPQIIADWPSDIADFTNMLITGPGMAVDMGDQTHLTILRHIDVYPTDVEGAIQHNAYWDAMALKRFCELAKA